MRVLLTGHEGYLGAVMSRVLVADGHRVVGLDTGYFSGCDLGPPAPALPSIGADVRDVVPADCEGFDAVVHLAALSNDPLGNLAPELTHEINVEGSARLAMAAREAGVGRFIFASSCSIYGASGGDELVDESAPLRPVTPYAESKVRTEDLLRDLADGDFAPVVLRNATVYGFSPRLRTDLVVNDLVASAVLDGQVRVLSDGSPWRPVVHVEDVARVVVATLAAPVDAVRGEVLNVGSGPQNHRVRDLAEIVAAVTGAEIRITGERGPDPRSYRVDFSRLARVLPGFAVSWDVEAGVTELLSAYRRHELDRDSVHHRFTRLARLRALREDGRLGPDLRWVDATIRR
jgi:nucleoside-diphosphate-sugar epimerase